MPAHSSKLALLFFITFFVSFYFLLPKINVGFRRTKVFAFFMTMPKTTIYKNDSSIFTKYYIGMTGKAWMIEPIAEATAKKEFPNQ
ncbi:hypothetical protein M077_1252 [Bacteroides fragilis str. 2-F-2 |nr:hypothetical protein M077_1252 [Bacteroides fragilis str. 2-F-2 \